MFVTNIISIQRAFRQRIAQIAIVAMGILPAPLFAAEASAENTKPIEARNVVLVRGAWADGSSRARSSPIFKLPG